MRDYGTERSSTSQSPLREIGEHLLALVAIVGFLCLGLVSPWIPLSGFALLLAAGMQLWLEQQLGRKIAAILFIVVTFALAIAVVAEHASVELCFLALSLGSFELFRARRAFAPEGFSAALIRGLFRIWTTLAAVSGVIWTASYRLSVVPPEHLLDWSRGLELIQRFVEATEKVSTAVLTLLIALYFVSLRWNPISHWHATAWRGTIFSRKFLEWASLILASLGGFCFIAGGTVNGPVEELTQARAKALSDYRNIVWKVELAIREHVAFQIMNEAFQASPASVKSAITAENALCARPTPAIYFKPNFANATADDLIVSKDPISERVEMFEALTRKSLDEEQRSSSEITPPSGLTIGQLVSANSEFPNLEPFEDHQPRAITGLGSDVLAQVIELGISPDRISVLKLLGDQMPLAGKLISAAFDAMDESVTAGIKTQAVQMTNLRLTGELATLQQGVTRAADIIRREIVRRSPGPADWSNIETVALSEREEADRAARAFHRDLIAAVESEAGRMARDIALYSSLAGPGQTNDIRTILASGELASAIRLVPEAKRTLQFLDSSEPTLDKLRAQRRATEFAEAQIGAYVYRHRGQYDRFKRVLGKDFGRFEELGNTQEMQRKPPPDRARGEFEERPVEHAIP